MITGEGLRKVMLVSEKAWQSDHYMMHRLIQRSGGLDESYFYFADLFTPNLKDEIRDRGVRVVMPLGEAAFQRLTGEVDILRWRGRVQDWDDRYLIPTFAPHKLLPENPNAAQILADRKRGIRQIENPPKFQGVWMLDVEYALQVSKSGFTRRRASYIVDPTPSDFQKWIEEYLKKGCPPLSFDIETPYKMKKGEEGEFEESESDSVVLRISFSYEEYTGISVPYVGAYLDGIRTLLACASDKICWNGLTFDIPVLEKVDMPVVGVVYDYMDGFHLYQSDLPKGLEFVSSFTSDLLPWKHLSHSDPGLYSAIDADAALRNANWLNTKLHQTGQWQTFLNHYVRLMPALHTAGKHGVFINIPKRDELHHEMQELMDAKVVELQPLVPLVVKPRKRYKREPFPEDCPRQPGTPVRVEWEGRVFESVAVLGKVKVCSFCGEPASNKSEHYKGGKKNPCKVMGGEQIEKEDYLVEWDEILPFNPNSADHVKEYARHFKHPIGENRKDAQKETMDANHIKTLIRAYPKHAEFYTKVLEIKKLRKTLGTYIYDPDENGLAHGTYKNAPSTPRLSQANKNFQNCGKREENYWATRAREQIIARPGYRLVQADSSAIEAVVQGWWMGDIEYMALATQSVHAWVVAKMHGIPWEGTEEQVAFFKHEYKSDYNKYKTTNYLTNFGGGPYLLWKSFPEVFKEKEDAERAQATLYEMLPKLKEFHHWVRTKAQKESYLELPGWKHRHYFYDVFSIDPKTGRLKFGHDSKRVCAFFPQGCAAAFMRDNSLLIAYGDQAAEWLGIEPLGLGDGYLQWMPANFVVHDGYTLEVPDKKEEEVTLALEKVLTRPIPQLSNLQVGCEVDVSPIGGNWAPSSSKNPMGLETVKVCRVSVVPPPCKEVRLKAA